MPDTRLSIRVRAVDQERMRRIIGALELDDAPQVVAIRLALKHYCEHLEATHRELVETSAAA